MSMAPFGVVQEVTGVVLPATLMGGLVFGTTALVVAVQLVTTSVTVTEYVPAEIPERSSVVTPFDQRNVYEPAGETLRSTAPLGCPQVVPVLLALGTGGAVLLATVKLADDVQLPPADTVTV
jgi:hypothetical protein